MNRYFLTLSLVLSMAVMSLAQSQFEFVPVNRTLKFKDQSAESNFGLGKKSEENGWLTPVKLMEDYGATFQGSSYFPLFQDSTVFFVPSPDATSQDLFSNSWNLFGTVFQPEDPLYVLQTDGWQFTRFTHYTCDSVNFPYSYIRQVDQIEVGGNMVDVVDTVFIHFYQNKNLNCTWFFNNSEEVFAMPIRDQFSIDKLAPKDVAFIDTILLTADAVTDTEFGDNININSITRAISAAVADVPGDNSDKNTNVIGVSIAFKTMVPYSFGDTLLSYNDAVTPSKKFNVFGTASYYNQGSRVVQTQTYNNSFVTNRQVRYGQKVGSNLWGYIPTLQSVGWNTDFYFPASFHVTGLNVGINEVANNTKIQVYPNPAKKGSDIVVSTSSVKASTVTIQLIDVVGNVVYSTQTTSANQYTIPTSDVVPGIYFVNFSANGATASQRIVITE